MQIKTKTEIPSHTSQNGYSQEKQITTNAGEDAGEEEHLDTVGGNVN
jgi:hypothetical protein